PCTPTDAMIRRSATHNRSTRRWTMVTTNGLIRCCAQPGDAESEQKRLHRLANSAPPLHCYNDCMPSPFPGMDPYLEPHWLDVHTSLVSGARDALNQRLPDDLIASAEERVAVEGEEADRLWGPDVQVFE